MPKVHFLNEVVTVEDAPKGATIYEVAQKAGVQLFKGFFQSYHCSGKGRCLGAGCRVWVTEVEPNAVPQKKRKWWIPVGRKLHGTQRMACEATIQGDCEIRTQPGALTVEPDTTWEPDTRHFAWQDRLVVEKKKKKPKPAPKPKAEEPKAEAKAEAPKAEVKAEPVAEATPEPATEPSADAEPAGKPKRPAPSETDSGWED